MKKLSCMIPIYNEGKRPLQVIDQITNLKYIDQILCVDDGSKDNTSTKLIKEQFPQVELIKLEDNTGKSNAVKEGLIHVKNDDILLIDGDLKNIDIKTIQKGYELYLRQEIESAIIFVYPTSTILENILLGNIIVSGTRIISKNSLNHMFLIFKPLRYQLEPAINQYLLSKNVNTLLVNIVLDAPHKIKKYGLLHGLSSDVIKNFTVLSFGIKAWIDQYNFFSKKNSINL